MMLQRLRSALKGAIVQQCDWYLRAANRDLDLARERLAAEESASWISRNAIMAASFRDKFELLRHSIEAVEVDGLMCEFGVYRGETINYLSSLLPAKTFHGFDSFEGLPEDWRNGFEEGAFRREQLPAVRPNVFLHKGWFHESLPTFLKNHEEPVSFLHIDCDLCSSTRVVLDMLSNRIVPGTIIQFDEFLNYPSWQFGESKAFDEFSTEHEVEVQHLGYVARDEQLSMRIKAIGRLPTECRASNLVEAVGQ
jgi:hypothetical protein